MKYLHYSLALSAAGLFTGLAYHNLSRKHPLVISAVPPVNSDIENVLSTYVKSQNAKYAPVMEHGFPSYDTLRFRGNYVLSYDRKNKVAHWVMEYLTSDMFKTGEQAKRKNYFRQDRTIHGYFRSTMEDYKRSGYDKGHLAAAENYERSQSEMDETFIMSNIVPQNLHFNRGIWKSLENHVRNLVNKYESIYVCTGPLYLPRKLSPEEVLFSEHQPKEQMKKDEDVAEEHQPRKYVIYEVIGENSVAVPTHFFKIVLCKVKKNLYDMEAYIIPNTSIDRKIPLQHFMVPKDTIERAAGMLFFNQLPLNEIRSINGNEPWCANVEGGRDGRKNKLLGKKENLSQM